MMMMMLMIIFVDMCAIILANLRKIIYENELKLCRSFRIWLMLLALFFMFFLDVVRHVEQ